MPLLNFTKLKSIIELFREGFGHHVRKIVAITSIGLVGGFLGGISIGLVIPVFALVTNQSIPGSDIITEKIQWLFRILHIPYHLPYLMIFVGLLLLGKSLFLYLASYINVRTGSDFERVTRYELMKLTLNATWPYLSNYKLGYLERVIMDDISGATGLLTITSSIFITSSSLLMYALVAVNISPTVTLLTFVIGGTFLLIFKPVMFRMRGWSKAMSQMGKDVAHHINQHILGAKTVKANGVEGQVLQQSRVYFDEFRNRRIQTELYGVTFSSFLEPVSFVFITIVFITVYRKPEFSLPSFAAVIYLVQKMFSFINTIQSRINNANNMLPILQQIIDYKRAALANQEENIGEEKFSFKKSLEFKGVTFAYNSANPVLSDVSFVIEHSQTIGIIGPSGAGKTTLVDLLLRLLSPQSGTMLVDGQDTKKINLHDWRTHIAYVSQDIFLLNDTIENNIRFYNDTVSDADIIKSAKAANIYEFILTQELGLKTLIGERGIRLSGGQRQRVILARALARKPQILILDEATSSLDNESEAAIQKAIHSLRHTMTIIIIAHRLTTVIGADRLLVLDQGHITESGTPEELSRKKESYFFRMNNIK